VKFWRERVTVVVRHQASILAFRATDPTTQVNYVFLPGGGIEPGESREAAARRECLEETGCLVRVKLETEYVREYDFNWDGKSYACRTWFYAADLEKQLRTDVQDAQYHRGVVWVPETEVEKVFNYHPDILEAVKQLLAPLQN
jgi:8-oxo-dGTP pyrophosphatase MutT (NUDIX family)